MANCNLVKKLTFTKVITLFNIMSFFLLRIINGWNWVLVFEKINKKKSDLNQIFADNIWAIICTQLMSINC